MSIVYITRTRTLPAVAVAVRPAVVRRTFWPLLHSSGAVKVSAVREPAAAASRSRADTRAEVLPAIPRFRVAPAPIPAKAV